MDPAQTVPCARDLADATDSIRGQLARVVGMLAEVDDFGFEQHEGDGARAWARYQLRLARRELMRLDGRLAHDVRMFTVVSLAPTLSPRLAAEAIPTRPSRPGRPA